MKFVVSRDIISKKFFICYCKLLILTLVSKTVINLGWVHGFKFELYTDFSCVILVKMIRSYFELGPPVDRPIETFRRLRGIIESHEFFSLM